MPFGFGKPNRRRKLTSLIDEEMVGLLEPGVEFDGTLTVSSGILRLNTRFKGLIQSAATVVVAEEGDVEGEIRSRFISVTGKVRGNVHAAERLEIKERGIVHGDIYTPCLVVDPGGFFDGQCHMPVPEPKPEPPVTAEPDSTA